MAISRESFAQAATTMNHKLEHAEKALWMIGYGKPILDDTPQELIDVRDEARVALRDIDGVRRVDERLLSTRYRFEAEAIALEHLEWYCPICRRQVQAGDPHTHPLGNPLNAPNLEYPV